MTGGTDPQAPVFVLGLGAQKAGTTWLQAYLDHFPHSDFGEIKEYHIWDALYLPVCADYDTRARNKPLIQRMRWHWRGLKGHPRHPFQVRRDLQTDPDRYFDYFSRILDQPGITMTGDITPSYCGLPVDALVRIRDGFAARGISTRAVFLMREPVERCLSAIRMFRRNGVTREGVDVSLSDDQALLRYLDDPHGKMRSNYAGTLEAIQQAFSPQECYVGSYETMFSETAFEQLNTFFNLTPEPKFLNRTFNTTSAKNDIADETRAAAMEKLADIYKACFRYDPTLRQQWPKGAAAFPDT